MPCLTATHAAPSLVPSLIETRKTVPFVQIDTPIQTNWSYHDISFRFQAFVTQPDTPAAITLFLRLESPCPPQICNLI